MLIVHGHSAVQSDPHLPHCLACINVSVFSCLLAQMSIQVRIWYTSLMLIENSLNVLGTVLDTI